MTGILGGTFVDPTQYMTSVTSFNSDLFAAPHQLIADSLHSNDPKTRAILENAIKMVSANHGQRIHGKGKEALNQIDPFWRLTVSLNDAAPGCRYCHGRTGRWRTKCCCFGQAGRVICRTRTRR